MSIQSIRFGTEQPSPKQTAPTTTDRIIRRTHLLGTATLLAGLAVSLGGAVNANIKHDGKLNIVASSAEEAYAQKKAAMPGLLLLLTGTLIRGVSRQMKRHL